MLHSLPDLLPTARIAVHLLYTISAGDENRLAVSPYSFVADATTLNVHVIAQKL